MGGGFEISASGKKGGRVTLGFGFGVDFDSFLSAMQISETNKSKAVSDDLKIVKEK